MGYLQGYLLLPICRCLSEGGRIGPAYICARGRRTGLQPAEFCAVTRKTTVSAVSPFGTCRGGGVGTVVIASVSKLATDEVRAWPRWRTVAMVCVPSVGSSSHASPAPESWRTQFLCPVSNTFPGRAPRRGHVLQGGVKSAHLALEAVRADRAPVVLRRGPGSENACEPFAAAKGYLVTFYHSELIYMSPSARPRTAGSRWGRSR